MKKYVLFGLFLYLFACSYSQNALTINNYSRFKRMVYSPGDGIYLQTKDKLNFSGQVDAVNDSVLTISKVIEVTDESGTKKIRQQDYVPLREIRAVYTQHIPKKWGMTKTAAGTFLLSGVMFGVLSGWGYKAYGGATSNGKANLGLAIGSFVASAFVKIANPNKRKIGNHWEIKVSPLYKEEMSLENEK